METDLLQYNFFCKVKNTTSATTTQNKNNNTNKIMNFNFVSQIDDTKCFLLI